MHVESGKFADFGKMEKEEYRSVIESLFWKKQSRSEIKEHLAVLYGDFSPSMTTDRGTKNSLTSIDVVTYLVWIRYV